MVGWLVITIVSNVQQYQRISKLSNVWPYQLLNFTNVIQICLVFGSWGYNEKCSQESRKHLPIFKIATILPWPDTSYLRDIFLSQYLATKIQLIIQQPSSSSLNKNLHHNPPHCQLSKRWSVFFSDHISIRIMV